MTEALKSMIVGLAAIIVVCLAFAAIMALPKPIVHLISAGIPILLAAWISGYSLRMLWRMRK